MRMDLKDLPLRYRAQVEQQLAGRKKPDNLADKVNPLVKTNFCDFLS